MKKQYIFGIVFLSVFLISCSELGSKKAIEERNSMKPNYKIIAENGKITDITCKDNEKINVIIPPYCNFEIDNNFIANPLKICKNKNSVENIQINNSYKITHHTDARLIMFDEHESSCYIFDEVN